MSFGLSNEDDPAIRYRIREAYHRDIIMFAAACNEGGRSGVSYPASDRNVFCIRAFDDMGNWAEFNPHQEVCFLSPNFSYSLQACNACFGLCVHRMRWLEHDGILPIARDGLHLLLSVTMLGVF
jgi:hypothetical protein